MPWMRCIETLIRSKKEAKESEAMVLFYKEISSLVFSSKNLDIEIFETDSMNVATQLLLAKIKSPQMNLSGSEGSKIERYYPKFMEYVRSLP